jgi:hypothetical protein
MAAPRPNVTPYVKYKTVMFSVKKDEIRMPTTERMPPHSVVSRRPILSECLRNVAVGHQVALKSLQLPVKMPETGDNRKVVPMVRDPTRAEEKRLSRFSFLNNTKNFKF